MKILNNITRSFTIFLMLLSFGCEEKYSDDNFLLEPPITYDQLIEEGWTYFQEGDYTASIETFILASERDATQPEVYLGLAWGFARNIELTKAISNFQKAISFAFFDTENEKRILTESFAGLSLVSLASGSYTDCIDYAGQALSLNPEVTFSKDTTVDAQSLKLSQAESHYYLSDIQACFNILNELGVNIDNVTNTTMFGIISHTNNTLLTGEMKVYIDDAHQIISVTSARNGNINYEITSVEEGTNEFMVSGNPVIAIGDSIFASYYFTVDYAGFLNKLLDAIINF